MTQYAPMILKEFARLSTDHDLSIDKHKLLDMIEHYSERYKARQLNGSLNNHKEELQEIYETFGGTNDEELFPLIHKLSKKVEQPTKRLWDTHNHNGRNKNKRKT